VKLKHEMDGQFQRKVNWNVMTSWAHGVVTMLDEGNRMLCAPPLLTLLLRRTNRTAEFKRSRPSLCASQADIACGGVDVAGNIS
jgi:hypothetical protein